VKTRGTRFSCEKEDGAVIHMEGTAYNPQPRINKIIAWELLVRFVMLMALAVHPAEPKKSWVVNTCLKETQ
jgi:hypothetical protein